MNAFELDDMEMEAVTGGKTNDSKKNTKKVLLVCQGCGASKKFTEEKAQKLKYKYVCEDCK